MSERKKKKTNMQMQIDSTLWKRLAGLAKFKQVERNELLERAVKELLEREENN